MPTVDELILARFIWNLPDDVFDAMQELVDKEEVHGMVLAEFLNTLPENVLIACKRILQIKDNDDSSAPTER